MIASNTATDSAVVHVILDLVTTMVLIGFSCAGKSTIVSELENKIECNSIDSDQRVADTLGCSNIWHVYYEFGRDDALRLIEGAERKFLGSLRGTPGTDVIAAGPFLPIRTGAWDKFVSRVKPILVQLTISPRDATNGLLERRRRMQRNPDFDSENQRFGCWDEGVTTRFANGRWVELPQEVCEANVARHIGALQAGYDNGSRGAVEQLEGRDPATIPALLDLVAQG